MTDIDRCASCVKGYYLTDTATCAACNITGCISCDNQNYCNLCKKGYILSGPSSSATCTQCDPSCATCFDSPLNCEACAEGYFRAGPNCVNKQNINGTFKVAGSLASITTSQIEAISATICNATRKNKSQYILNSLKDGSVIVSFTLNSANSAQQAADLANLNLLLAVGNSIGGSPI